MAHQLLRLVLRYYCCRCNPLYAVTAQQRWMIRPIYIAKCIMTMWRFAGGGIAGGGAAPSPLHPSTRFYFLISFPCYLLSFVFIHMYSHLFFFDPPFPQFLDDFHYDRPYLFFWSLFVFFLISRFCFFLILICFFFDPLAQRCKLLIQRLPSYLAAKLCTSIINHTYVYIQYVYICVHLYTFVHRDTHAWIIYDHTMYINVHRTNGFLCLLLQRLDTLHNFSWTRTCGTSEPEPKVKSPDIHTIGIIGESYGSYASFFPQDAIHGILRYTPPSLAVAGSHPWITVLPLAYFFWESGGTFFFCL